MDNRHTQARSMNWSDGLEDYLFKPYYIMEIYLCVSPILLNCVRFPNVVVYNQ